MASKTCPVCKTFSSSSNTTLNVHIDQCLSTMKWTENPEVIIKHRIKPRIKMRLMMDIYKTAPHCTIEELDARNGTSWANNSSFPDQEIEFEATTNVDHEGEVYSDNNRTIVRKADNNTSNDGSQKKRGKFVKVFSVKKKSKNQELKHDQKYSKQTPNSKKSSSEVTTGPEENVGNGENCNKEFMNKDDKPIVRPPWACSKRTCLAKTNPRVACGKSFSKSSFKFASSASNKTGILSQQNSQETKSLTQSKLLFAKKRSILLTKPSSKHLQKRDTILHNSCVDPSVSCLVKGSDVRSKGRKTASKINLKRKFSALERRQDSLKQKSFIKEDASVKTSCKSLKLLEVKNNKKMETCRPENSVSSRSLNQDSSQLKTCIADPSSGIESVRKEACVIDNMFDPRDHAGDVTDDTERQQQQPPYHDMSDSPNSTVSNPSLTRSDSDKFSVRSTPRNDAKYALVTLKNFGDWRSMGQSQTTSFKNDHQPCCCSRKEIALFPTSPPPPLLQPVKLPPYRECDAAASPLKPVIRLMGKNLTVVNTDEDKVNCSQFPNAQHRFNGFKSQQSTFHPPNSLKNHGLDTMFQSSTHACYYEHAINSSNFQAC